MQADLLPSTPGGALPDWSMNLLRMNRVPSPGQGNMPLVVAPVWPTLLVGSVGHPPRNGACTPIAARWFLAAPPFIGPSSKGYCLGAPARACKMCFW